MCLPPPRLITARRMKHAGSFERFDTTMTVSALRLTSTDSLCYKYAWNQNGRPLNKLNIVFGGYFYLLPVRLTGRRDHAVDNASRASTAQRRSSVDG